MRRVISLYLPTWSTDRLRHARRRLAARLIANGSPRDAEVAATPPVVIAGRQGSRRIVVAADPAARALGLHPGLPLTEAQARIPGLDIEPEDPAADAASLERLALWTYRRYSPVVAVDPPDGLLIDVTGAAHLLGGEAAMLSDLLRRLAGFGVGARAALAPTVGAAHALARFSTSPATLAPSEATPPLLDPLPVAALRLDAALVDRLRRLGFDTVGELAAAPRPGLALRFGSSPGRRLDQAYGCQAEPIEPLLPAEIVQVRRSFAEPIAAAETLARYTGRLVTALTETLERQGLGARRLDLLFHRVDNIVETIRVGTAKPVRDPRRLTRLLLDRLETVDPGFGVETMVLTATLAEPLAGRQQALKSNLSDGGADQADVSALIDTLANRLGSDRLYRITPVESDLPERSVRRVAPLDPPSGAVWPAHWPRPGRLLKPPEPVETLSLLPDQPPVHFTWRGVRRRVRQADGPERVFGEWWRREDELEAVRDYFLVEDEAGERFWLFRNGDGVAPATGNLDWYIHGIFA